MHDVDYRKIPHPENAQVKQIHTLARLQPQRWLTPPFPAFHS